MSETLTTPGAPAAGPAPVPLGRNRHFLLLWVGAAVSGLGSRATAIGYTLLVYWSTGSATQAGLVAFAALLPTLLVQMPAGALVDRWDRRRTLVVCNVGRVLGVGSVAVAVAGGHVWLAHLMVVAFVEATLTVFYVLAERAAVCTVVARGQLGAAMSANEARQYGAGLLGQPGGTLLYTLTRWAPFGAAAVAHAVAFVALLFVRRPLQDDRPPPVNRPRITAQIAEGFRFVWGQLYLRRALALLAASNVLFQVTALGLVVIVRQDGGPPAHVGIVLMASSLAGMAGAMTGNFHMERWGIRRIIMTVNVSWAVLMPLIGLAPGVVTLAVLYALISYGAGVGNVAGIVYQVRTTPDRLRGRAGSVSTLLAAGSSSLGALVAGVALDAVDTRTALLAVGAVMAVIAVFAVLAFAGPTAAAAE
ncbi:MAG TPA: MFS transporter, partial [Pseudonocardiaceae bacterium]